MHTCLCNTFSRNQIGININILSSDTPIKILIIISRLLAVVVVTVFVTEIMLYSSARHFERVKNICTCRGWCHAQTSSQTPAHTAHSHSKLIRMEICAFTSNN